MYSQIKHTRYLYAGIVFSLLSLYTYLDSYFGWLTLGWWKNSTMNFEDLASTLSSSDCFSKQSNVELFFSDANVCDYNYGKIGIYFYRIVGFSIESKLIFGMILAIWLLASIAVLAVVSFKISKEFKIITLIILLSPPLQLLLQRGNLDIVIFALLCISAVGFNRRNYLLSVLPLVISTLLKAYTLSGFILVFLLFQKSKNRIMTIFIFILVSVEIFREFNQVALPSKYFSSSFGLQAFGILLNKLGLSINFIIQDLIGMFILFLIFLASKNKILKGVTKFSFESKDQNVYKTEVVAALSSLIFLTCFFAYMSFDYRLPILLPALLLELRFWSQSDQKRLYFLLISTSILSFWFTVGFKMVSPIGDLCLNLLVLIFMKKWYLTLKDVKLFSTFIQKL